MDEKNAPVIPARLAGMLSDSQENILFEFRKLCLCLACDPATMDRYNKRGKFVLIPLDDLGSLIQVCVGNGVMIVIE